MLLDVQLSNSHWTQIRMEISNLASFILDAHLSWLKDNENSRKLVPAACQVSLLTTERQLARMRTSESQCFAYLSHHRSVIMVYPFRLLITHEHQQFEVGSHFISLSIPALIHGDVMAHDWPMETQSLGHANNLFSKHSFVLASRNAVTCPNRDSG